MKCDKLEWNGHQKFLAFLQLQKIPDNFCFSKPIFYWKQSLGAPVTTFLFLPSGSLWGGESCKTGSPRWSLVINREIIKIHVYTVGQTANVNLYHVTFTVYYFYSKISIWRASFIHKNCPGHFLSAYFLLWEILNLRLTFAVWRKRDFLGAFTLSGTSSRARYKMVLYPHSGYPSCLSSTLLRQQTPFLQKERRSWLFVKLLGANEKKPNSQDPVPTLVPGYNVSGTGTVPEF